ncbi:MAG: CAP domain-containing protein [Chloroflexia bacterium]|nr:CAP domain-containing protein [Chloroflexia bacterium]
MSSNMRIVIWPLLILVLLWAFPGITPQSRGTLAALMGSQAAGKGKDLPTSDPQVRRGHELLVAINRARYEQGRLPPLRLNPLLSEAAQLHSQSMAEDDFFGHKGRGDTSPWDRIGVQGYTCWFVLAENVGVGYTDPEEVVQAWMNSPQHRANLLNTEVREAGVGYAFDPQDSYPGESWGYQHYWTLDLGACSDVYPLVIESEAYTTSERIVHIYQYGGPDLSEMRLSQDGLNWTPWLRYEPWKLWQLPAGNSRKTLYVQSRDHQGRIFEASDEILLQEPPPITQPAQQEPTSLQIQSALLLLTGPAHINQ